MTKYCKFKTFYIKYTYVIQQSKLKAGIGANLIGHNANLKQHVDDFSIVFKPMSSIVMTGIMTTTKNLKKQKNAFVIQVQISIDITSSF